VTQARKENVFDRRWMMRTDMDRSTTQVRPMPLSVGLVLVLAAAFAGPVIVGQFLARLDPAVSLLMPAVVAIYGVYPGIVAWIARTTGREQVIVPVALVAPGWLAMQWLGGNIVMGVLVAGGVLIAIALALTAMRGGGPARVLLGFVVGFIATILVVWVPLMVMLPVHLF
jgi:hypothetical protein